MTRRSPFVVFTITFALAAIAFMVWWQWVGTNGHWLPYCEADFCEDWPDYAGSSKVAVIFATILATEAAALATPGRARLIGLAAIPLLVLTAAWFLFPELRAATTG